MKITELLLPGFDPLQFLCKLGAAAREPVLVRSGRWVVLAWDPAERITWRREAEWEKLEAFLRRRRTRDRSGLPFIGGMIGYCSYDLGYALHGIAPSARDELKLPLLSLGVYDRALCWDGRRIVAIGDRAFRREVCDIHARPLPTAVIPPIEFSPSVSRRKYGHALRRTLRAIRDGSVYQLNYTYMLRGDADCDERQLFALLARRHPSPCMSYLETPETSLLSLSPEEFISLQGRRLRTCPIKGTRPRGTTPEEDRQQRAALLASGKEQAELNMITDLLRNDLGRIARPGSVRVRERRLVQQLPSVWHTYSVIDAELAGGRSAVDILRAMLPGGSVTGCPKARAMELIDDLEGMRRGPYTGSVILLSDDGSLGSSIIIRTAIARKRRLWVGVGGGIVDESDIASEYDETLRKAAPFLALKDGQVRFWVDGRPARPDSPLLKFLDGKNTRARGVFETLKVDEGRILFLSEHLKRLQRSAKLTGLRLPKNLRQIRAFLLRASRACPWSPARPAGRSPARTTPSGWDGPARLKVVCTDRHILIQSSELTLDAAEVGGIAVKIIPLTRRMPQAKALPYHREVAAHEVAVHDGFHEALLVDRQGFVREGAYSNIFWVEKGDIWTPGEGMLPGITRAAVLSIAKRLRVPMRFGLPTEKRLARADEAFLTRTTAGVVPVVRIESHAIGSGKPGPVTIRLRKAYTSLVMTKPQ
ncbi:MAG: chorismate-binding protein [Candidatus Peribacteraceae bacterium]